MPKDKNIKKKPVVKRSRNETLKERANVAKEKFADAKIEQPETDMTGMELEWEPFDYKGVGAHSLYTDELLPKVEKLASEGLNNAEIARALSIGNRTFYEWRDKYPQFWHSILKYRGLADIMVENALYKGAVGYNYVEQAVTMRGKVVDVVKHQRGNTAAQIFYLKNRMPERYKDKVETQISIAQDISALAFAIKRREE